MAGRLRVDEITSSQNAAPLASAGLRFPNVEAGAAFPTTLDWYEKGTFTPTISGGTTAGTATYVANRRVGVYVRIGNIVALNCRVAWTAHTGTGVLRITGLPYFPGLLGMATADAGVAMIPLGMLNVAGGVWLHSDGNVYVNSATAFTTVDLAATGDILFSVAFPAGT